MNIPIVDRNAVLPAVGDAVDVVFRSKPREGQNDTAISIPEATVTLLEAVDVVKINKPAPTQQNDANSRDLRRNANQTQAPPVVTLAVTLDQANALKTVEGRGDLTLVVRSPGDAGSGSNHDKLTLEKLLDLKPKPVPFTTEIYRGGNRQTLKFDRGQVADESFGGTIVSRRRTSSAPSDEQPAATRQAVSVQPTGGPSDLGIPNTQALPLPGNGKF
jgi:Flp pilus assembly protein CpaB